MSDDQTKMLTRLYYRCLHVVSHLRERALAITIADALERDASRVKPFIDDKHRRVEYVLVSNRVRDWPASRRIAADTRRGETRIIQ